MIEEVMEQRYLLMTYISRRRFYYGRCKHGMFWPAW